MIGVIVAVVASISVILHTNIVRPSVGVKTIGCWPENANNLVKPSACLLDGEPAAPPTQTVEPAEVVTSYPELSQRV